MTTQLKIDSEKPLVVCSGSNFGLILKKHSYLADELGVSFVMSNWLIEEEKLKTKAFWVVGKEGWLEDVLFAIDHKIPMIVPFGNGDLSAACISRALGLCYATEAQLKACIQHFLS